MLAPVARLAAGRCLGAAPAAPSQGVAGRRPHRLETGLGGRLVRRGQKGGRLTGPNPTDRGKAGSKHHHLVDRNALPLNEAVTPANTHDSKAPPPLVDSLPPVAGKRGRPRSRSTKLHADKGYDYPVMRRELWRGAIPRIARRGVESSQRLGQHRRVVERTIAWLRNFRRLTSRYERREDIHFALLQLGCCIILLRAAAPLCWRDTHEAAPSRACDQLRRDSPPRRKNLRRRRLRSGVLHALRHPVPVQLRGRGAVPRPSEPRLPLAERWRRTATVSWLWPPGLGLRGHAGYR